MINTLKLLNNQNVYLGIKTLKIQYPIQKDLIDSCYLYHNKNLLDKIINIKTVELLINNNLIKQFELLEHNNHYFIKYKISTIGKNILENNLRSEYLERSIN